MNTQEKYLEKFLKSSFESQKDILQAIGEKLDKPPEILEKDIWVCLALQKLFTMPNALTMAFKGGTSLSKAFHVIDRFSEDVDVTIDYRSFINEDPLLPCISNTKRKKLSDELKKALREHIKDTILPYLQTEIQSESDSPVTLNLTSDGEGIEIYFQSLFVATSNYIKPFVFLEFGARNITEPNNIHEIIPDLVDEVPTLQFPKASVTVLAPERTFWEKITMMHVECNRGNFKKNAERLSRHWYDVVMLYLSDIGKSAIQAKDILVSVVEHKTVFFNAPYAKYEQCLTGQFNLLPKGEQLEQLQLDYERMVKSNMFYGNPKSFAEILGTIEELSVVLSLIRTNDQASLISSDDVKNALKRFKKDHAETNETLREN